MAEINELDKRIIQTLAMCDLKPSEASRVLYMHRNTVIYHIEKIARVTGLDPLCFYDMIELLEVYGKEDTDG